MRILTIDRSGNTYAENLRAKSQTKPTGRFLVFTSEKIRSLAEAISLDSIFFSSTDLNKLKTETCWKYIKTIFFLCDFLLAHLYCTIIFAKRGECYKSTVSTDKNYLKLMAEISRENGARAFNYSRNTKNVLNISRLALPLSSPALVVSF